MLLATVQVVPGCAMANSWTDFTSVSHGKAMDGRLRRPKRLPNAGKGYTTPQTWRDRGRRYGTDEMIAMIQRAAAEVRGKDWRVKLGVADISQKQGGKITRHGSHQSGRDVDLIFYTVNADSRRPMPPPDVEMVHFGHDGKPFQPEWMKEPYQQLDWEERRFDDRRNWALVEALLTDEGVRVQWIFVSNGIKDRLLRYARRKDRPEWIIEFARVIMREPRKSPHDDHFHVRIYCSRTDRLYGCEDTGAIWQHEKKTYKYAGQEQYDPVAWGELLTAPVFFPRG